MLMVLRSTWPLFLGLMFLMLGNGIQGTLLGIRGGIEGFSTNEMAVVMSAYFGGFLVASRIAPKMIRSVGHVRVFAALGSFISAVLILFPAVAEPWAWTLLRAIMGFCFCGVYIVVESWLNESSANETRGQAMSLYLIVQMAGIIAAQFILNVGDPKGYILFVIPSVLVSIAFAPILLSASPAPAFETTRAMSLKALLDTSPLACASVFILGGVFSAIFGMASVFGTEAGLSVREISIFVAVIYAGGLVCQYPIGWLSDRMDRRALILGLSAFGAAMMFIGVVFSGAFTVLLVLGFVIGGTANPLYSLSVAYTNDYLGPEDMASASAGLLFINGVGAIGGPIVVGWLMNVIGPHGFFLYLGVLLASLAVYAVWRAFRHGPRDVETGAFVAIVPAATTATGIGAVYEEEAAHREEETVAKSE